MDGGRTPELDGLRGIAVAAVVLFHLTPDVRGRQNSALVGAILDVTDFGWVGVDLFFVLSGFLITSSLLVAKASPHYFRDFYARRALRILPLYALVLATAAVLFRTCPELRKGYPELAASLWWYVVHLQNWLSAVHSGDAFHSGFLAHFWSLGIEEQFYLFWPVLVLGLSRTRLLQVCVVLIVLPPLLRCAVLGWDSALPMQHFVYFGTVTRIDSLAMGGLLAVLGPRAIASLPVVAIAGVAGIVTCGLVLLASCGPHSFWGNVPMAGIGLSATAAGSALLIVVGLRGNRVLRLHGLRSLGKYSYAVYVFHLPLIHLVRHLLTTAGFSGTRFVVLFVGCVIFGSIGSAVLSWHLLERRALGLKRYFVSAPSCSTSPVFGEDNSRCDLHPTGTSCYGSPTSHVIKDA